MILYFINRFNLIFVIWLFKMQYFRRRRIIFGATLRDERLLQPGQLRRRVLAWFLRDLKNGCLGLSLYLLHEVLNLWGPIFQGCATVLDGVLDKFLSWSQITYFQACLTLLAGALLVETGNRLHLWCWIIRTCSHCGGLFDRCFVDVSEIIVAEHIWIWNLIDILSGWDGWFRVVVGRLLLAIVRFGIHLGALVRPLLIFTLVVGQIQSVLVVVCFRLALEISVVEWGLVWIMDILLIFIFDLLVSFVFSVQIVYILIDIPQIHEWRILATFLLRRWALWTFRSFCEFEVALSIWMLLLFQLQRWVIIHIVIFNDHNRLSYYFLNFWILINNYFQI